MAGDEFKNIRRCNDSRLTSGGIPLTIAQANAARLAVFRKNSDVVSGVRQISTLDSHTTLICIAYSDACWDLEGKPIRGTVLPFLGGPPRHWGCRSVLAPITKTFAELGLNIAEPKATTRASDEGQISATTTFDQFLKRKPQGYVDEMLGVGRAQLWRDGRVRCRDLLDEQGRILSLKELEARHPPQSPPP